MLDKCLLVLHSELCFIVDLSDVKACAVQLVLFIMAHERFTQLDYSPKMGLSKYKVLIEYLFIFVT